MSAIRETSEPDIIGRDSDKETVVQFLLQLGDGAISSGSGDVNGQER
jgi:hypothetical protein